MAKVGSKVTVTVARSEVTDLRIVGDRIVAGAVDLDRDGKTIATHELVTTDKTIPTKVAEAVKTINHWVQAWADEA